MSDKPILVTAGIIKKDDLILISQRKSDSLLEPNKWEFPGGKVEFLEKPEECLVREIKEELNIDIEILSLFGVFSHNYKYNNKEYHIVLLTYIAKYKSGDIKPLDVQNYDWISEKQVQRYEFAEADLPIVKKYYHSKL